MAFVKILFSILVSLPILLLGVWLFTRYVQNVVSKKSNETDTVNDAQSRRK